MSSVLCEKVGGVTTLTLNRPKARNAMNRAMVGELQSALEAAEKDGTRIVILRGAGGHFCAGGDIKDMAAARVQPTSAPDPIAALNALFGELALRVAESPLPIVAVVEGAVLGGGFGLACACDVVIAAEEVDFRLPETGLGVVPAQIAPFLVERLGFSEAKRLALTGARLNASAALELGLVHEIASDVDEALARTNKRLLRAAPEASAATKRLFRRFATVNADDIQHAAQVFATAARGPEAAEGMSAFVQKRAPNWAAGEEETHE